MTTSDAHDVLRVSGARQHNLRDVSVEIPKRRLTVFTGVSGSGKSSLVFATIAAESQRLINETYSAFVQGFMPSMARPDVDALEGLTAAIIVDQERMGSNPRSTVGTASDAHSALRVLFSRAGQPHLGPPAAFSFNTPSVTAKGSMTVQRGTAQKQATTFTRTGGMCPECEGRGTVTALDVDELVDQDKALQDEGAIRVPGYKAGGWSVRYYAESGLLDPTKRIRDYTDQERHDLLHREPERRKMLGMTTTYEGLIPKIRSSMLAKDRESMQPHIRAFVDRAVTFAACPECGGTRLSQGALACRIDGRSIADVCALQVTELAEWVRGLQLPELAPLLSSLQGILDAMIDIGLGYLSLDRASGSLSGGEAQRLKMVRHLGSALTDVTYVFDEPTTGLHPRDIERMNRLLQSLRDTGSTVLVVEHKPEVMCVADQIVDLGPGAGADGGRITFQGTFPELAASDTLTGRHASRRSALKDDAELRSPTGALEIRGADRHNLRVVDVDIPLGVLTVVTGVAGSGKSSLIHGCLPAEAVREHGVVSIDQAPIRGSRRSNPATYTGLLEPIRKAFARANGVKPALFSANSEGACPQCGGAGVIDSEQLGRHAAAVPCELCEGRRYDAAVLEHTLGGLDIAQVLELSVAQAEEHFRDGEAKVPAAHRILVRLLEVGLGYLTIGQPLTALSGGERQRLRLAAHLGEKGGVIVLDEPTSGLHLADVENLLGLLDRLVDSGRTVIVIEHHQAVMARADWIIDLGPGAGIEGGQVVFEGTPAQLAAEASTLTGQHLAQYLRG